MTLREYIENNNSNNQVDCRAGVKYYLYLKDGVHKIICKGFDRTGKTVLFTDDVVPPSPPTRIKYVTVKYWKDYSCSFDSPKKIEFLKRYDRR